ncbi:sensor histidine kinase [Bradyrhizobium frederickii]|uniref:Sensor histidine kinase n=1 Tax=Bradyrhizobium frederickii TaxID=2560054 RepID=A0A4Y9P5Y1_9BRAD|nr:ATP-binding protein [Bradyrhizobium frederickii]TFV75821.1 sensor histidine kinase [Bradyrhizobium frederickii]
MTPNSHDLIDAAKRLRKLGVPVELSGLGRVKVRVFLASGCLLMQSDRCSRLELIVSELVSNAARYARFDEQANIEIELMHEADFLHCTVSDNGAEPARPIRGLEIAHRLAKDLCGRISHWFDDERTSLVLSIPLTERELQANTSPAGG